MLSQRKRTPTVVIFGGGMGGLAAAHELAREGLDVTVFEGGSALGGKARSHYLEGTGTEGRRDLPGEHGFRFYPAFYRHVVQTMDEIPDAESPTGRVSGNLVSAPEAGVAMPGQGVIVSPRRATSFSDLKRTLDGLARTGGSARDLARYLAAHLKYMSACNARRDGEIEATAWATFIKADAPGLYQEEFRQVLLACTRTMVAMDAEQGSSRTLGHASSLLLRDAFRGGPVDRTMMGPTSECWLDPWRALLESWGVRFELGSRLESLELDRSGRRVARAWVTMPDQRRVEVEADAFVLAVPLETAHRLVSRELADADPELAKIASCDVERSTNWMTGAQYFLRTDLPLCEGHLFFPASPWSLTAISQAQFWNRGRRHMHRYGDGRLRGILSIDISSCFVPDADGVRLVDETSREGILRRVLAQVMEGLDDRTARRLEDAVYAAKLDDEISVDDHGVRNAGRLLVHPPGSRAHRPNARCELENLQLASDYVRTSMDLASMESANEAGRLAAQSVLSRLGLNPESVSLFPFEEVEVLRPLRRIDAWLHARGMPHLVDLADRLLGPARAPELEPPFVPPLIAPTSSTALEG